MHASLAVESRNPPCTDKIRAQLQRIVTSPEFPSVGRGRAFLSYIVEEVLAGRESRIKGYSIALEVFRRDEGFTQEDPVVRIEAGRLRRALERYYLVAGQADPIRIEIPKGGYVPVFTWKAPALSGLGVSGGERDAVSASPLQQAWWATPQPFTVAMTGVSVIVLGAACWLAVQAFTGTVADAGHVGPGEPTLVVAPFANFGEGAQAQLYTVGLTEELLTTLPHFKEIRVFGRETSKALPPDVDVKQVREQLGARYLLAGSVRVAGDRMRISARLLDTRDGAILWSQNYDNDLRSRDLFTIQTEVASRVASAVAQPYGIMAKADAARPPPDERGAYQCILNFYAYRAELGAESHAVVRGCLEKAVARYPNYATAWAMLSIVYLDEDRFEFNRASGDATPVQRALATARRAIRIEPGNTRALQALMTALFFNREVDEAIRVGEQALATNPNDTELMGEFATRLAISGQWQRGAALLDQAIALNPGGGGFYRGTRALAAYMLEDYANAVIEIGRADLQKFPLFHIVAAIIYAEAGRLQDARRAGAIFERMRPDFLPNIVTELKSRNMQPADIARLIAGVRKAGMTIPEAEGTLAAASDLQPR